MLRLPEISSDDAEVIAEAPQDSLDAIEDFDQRSQALDEAAKNFTRSHAALHREIIQERVAMWDELERKFNLDRRNNVYQIASVDGRPMLVKRQEQS